MKRIPPRAALTYVRMIRRQHATKVLQHLFLHRKRIRVPSKLRVCLSKVVHGQACTSIQLKNVEVKTKTFCLTINTCCMKRIPPHASLTYVRMVRRQHATPKLQHPFVHRKSIRAPSKRRVRLSKVAHGRA
jgi:hypothetical protein